VNILTAFPRLYFLNLSNNLLTQPIDENSNMLQALNNANLSMRKVSEVFRTIEMSWILKRELAKDMVFAVVIR
jgi:hypothetical protein